MKKSVLVALLVIIAAYVTYAQSRGAAPKAVSFTGPIRTPVMQLSTGAKLDVPLYAQQTSLWCWDASSLMVIKYYRPASTLQQCDLANQAENVTTCCNNPFLAVCIKSGWEMLSNNGFTFNDNASAPSWDDLRTQINSNTPILYAWGWWAWEGGGGHMMVAVGYYTLLDQQYVVINNPWPPPSLVRTYLGISVRNPGGAQESYTYAAWVGGTGYNHFFWHDWYNIVDTTQIVRYPHRPLPQFPIEPSAPIRPGPIVEAVQVPQVVIQEAQRTLDALRRAPRDVQILNGLGEGAAAHATLGSPMHEYVVGLDSLRTFRRGMDPKRLILDGREFFFPILADGHLRSSVRVMLTSDQRAMTESIGNVTLVEQLGALGLSDRLSRSPTTAINAVRIPVLGLYFVYRTQDGNVQLASLFDVPAYKLSRGVYQNAEDIFSTLSAIARRERGAM